ncbi:hypothetical protein D3C77_592520 [compost metagenome]
MSYTENPIQVLRKFSTKINDELYDNNTIELKVNLSDAILPFNKYKYGMKPLPRVEQMFDVLGRYITEHANPHHISQVQDCIVFGNKSFLLFTELDYKELHEFVSILERDFPEARNITITSNIPLPE